jgi:hypothetical protein
MKRATFRQCLCIALLLTTSAALAQSTSFSQRYSTVPASADGIGKRYMDRDISAVMGWQGAAWLEREEREREERTDLLLAALALQPGMVVSNEPGFYKDGEYGIRIENLQVVTPASSIAGGERSMLGFEQLTLAPIDRRLMVKAMMTPEEIAQIDAYHARVVAMIAPHLEAPIADWLRGVCAPL